jgi:hypothetical protein
MLYQAATAPTQPGTSVPERVSGRPAHAVFPAGSSITAFAARPGTLIVIAHRMSSALRVGRVLVLDGFSARVGDHAVV